jgi:hypothetical protein
MKLPQRVAAWDKVMSLMLARAKKELEEGPATTVDDYSKD